MDVVYDPNVKVHLTVDERKRVRGTNHLDEYWAADEETPVEAAIAYVRSFAGLLEMPDDRLERMHEPVSYLAPREQGIEYRLSEIKPHFDAATVGFAQTVLNTSVWGAGLTVTVKGGPHRVVSAVNTSHDEPRAALPAERTLDRYREQFAAAEAERRLRDAGLAPSPNGRSRTRAGEKADESQTADFVRGLLAADDKEGNGGRTRRRQRDNARLIRGRFFVYRYDPDARLPQQTDVDPDKPQDEEHAPQPVLPLEPVPDTIKAGEYYLTAEVTFSLFTPEFGDLVWLALVEVETGAVLLLRALAAAVNGMVFRVDPITASGNAANDAAQGNAVLNPFRTLVSLPNLGAPVGGTQALGGTRANVTEVEAPTVAAPTEASGTDFSYNARTNNFAAVNAYYHVDRFFQVVESLGFPLATYFNGTTFPVPVDHRDLGTTINAHCVGNGAGGIGHVGYALNDLSDTVNPIGRACDSRVHWHELGGHGVLYEHVNWANFGFAHSAGDSLSAIFHDPESLAPDRFRYAPWNPINTRRFDRDVAAGWAWGGVEDAAFTAADPAGYDAEQVLATTLFRLYRSIGGDSSDLGRRQFASRMTMYLILRAIGTLTQATNPATALGFANALLAVDGLNWTSEGIYGGAYGKVIRWAFEKQGLYQAAGAPTPVVTAGAPAEFDVYIDDGRAGEYQFQAVHWNTTTIWNRQAADGMPTHEEPILGQPNYAYVRIKNRGTQTATNVRVKGFHCKPSAGVLWPNDLQAMTTPEIVVGTLLGNNGEEKIVGPFEWTPVLNAWGHDCLLMIASANGDASNVDNFTPGEVIQDWRLVPNDNNIGQRNVFPAAGGGGGEGLLRALHGKSFWVGNPNPKRATMELRVELPAVLTEAGWSLSVRDLPEGRFVLAPGKQREVSIDLRPGRDFDRRQVEEMAPQDVAVNVYADGMLIGGMTYRLDPDVKQPANRELARPGRRDRARAQDRARELLHALDIPAEEVTCVRVKKVLLDVELIGDSDCS